MANRDRKEVKLSTVICYEIIFPDLSGGLWIKGPRS